MAHNPSRRDFLKLAGSLPVGLATSKVLQKLGIPSQQLNDRKNILIIVFDAFSAYHLSTYGYQRETTPNINRLSRSAIVFHNHYAGGNYTTPGTASILTGTLPWTHRALQPRSITIPSFTKRNIFSFFNDYYRIAYTHNPWANILLEQFADDIDELIPMLSLFIDSYDGFIHNMFRKDYDIASVSWLRNTYVSKEGYSYSLFLSHVYETLRKKSISYLRAEYPRGIPSMDRVESNFTIDQAVNSIMGRLVHVPQPFLGYFHFLPPHGPYRTSIQFFNAFAEDGFTPPNKPEDPFSKGKSYDELLVERKNYDEFILYVDHHFGLFFEQLNNSGLLENTWVFLTSDHGEMFERGLVGHNNNAMYQPVLRIPLMIFEPGRTKGDNIFAPTSAIDIIPTLLHLSGREIPGWIEGEILPPFDSKPPDLNRSIYSVRANKTEKNEPITSTSTVLVKGRYKIHYYDGYDEWKLPGEVIKLFDIAKDPEELNDLSFSHKDVASNLLDELKKNLAEANKPYM